MKKVSLLLLLIIFGLANAVQASTITLGSSYNNKIQYENYENVFRKDANGDYRLVSYDRDITSTNIPELEVGDVFVGILSVQRIEHDGLFPFESSSGVDEITGIFAQKITNINTAPNLNTGGFDIQIDLGVADSNTFYTSDTGTETLDLGLDLAAGEILRFFHDDGSDGNAVTAFNSAGGLTMKQSFDRAADGTRWLSVGIDANEDPIDYLYSNTTQQGTTLEHFDGESFMGLSILYADFVGWLDDGINDTSETRFNSDVDFFANSELTANSSYPTGRSAWVFQSNDPAEIGPVPEPGTFVLFGTALLGFSAMLRRKKIS